MYGIKAEMIMKYLVLLNGSQVLRSTCWHYFSFCFICKWNKQTKKLLLSFLHAPLVSEVLFLSGTLALPCAVSIQVTFLTKIRNLHVSLI